MSSTGRGAIARHQVGEVGRRQVVGEDDAGRRLHRDRRDPAERLRRGVGHVLLLGGRAQAGALGHHGAQAAVVGRGLQQQLAADGQAEAADAAAAHVRARAQVGDGRAEVGLAAPAARVEVALALALAAAVEQQHPVAVAHEHARVADRALAAGEGDHRGAVARRHVPAGEPQPVARRQRHVDVRPPEVHPLHRRARLVVGHDREPDRHDDEDAANAATAPTSARRR